MKTKRIRFKVAVLAIRPGLFINFRRTADKNQAVRVMKRREARKPRYGGKPLSGQVVADQQEVADTFFKPGLIPKAIRVEDLVYCSSK